MVRFHAAPRGLKSVMPHNDITSTEGEPVNLRPGVFGTVCPTTDEGGQKECRQSDGRMVPMKVGNATGGKPREDCTSQSCHAKQYQRGNISHTQRWEDNGNEIGENITVIK